MDGSPCTLQWGTPFPLKIVPAHGGSGRLSNTWFLMPTRVHSPNGISISSSVFAGLMIVTDRPTNRQINRQTMLLCLKQ